MNITKRCIIAIIITFNIYAQIVTAELSHATSETVSPIPIHFVISSIVNDTRSDLIFDIDWAPAFTILAHSTRDYGTSTDNYMLAIPLQGTIDKNIDAIAYKNAHYLSIRQSNKNKPFMKLDIKEWQYLHDEKTIEIVSAMCINTTQKNSPKTLAKFKETFELNPQSKVYFTYDVSIVLRELYDHSISPKLQARKYLIETTKNDKGDNSL